MCHVIQHSPVSPHNHPDFPLRLRFVCSIAWVSPTVSQKPEPVTSLYFRIPHGHKLCEAGYSKEGAKPKSGSSLCGEEASEVMWRIGRPMKEETYVAKQNLKNKQNSCWVGYKKLFTGFSTGKGRGGGKKWVSK